MNTRSFPDQLTDMWRTRPVRLPENGHIAGVSAGIGVRYGIDPVLVRVAFVVSALFGGAGVVLYLAAWVLFTRHGDQASPLESLVGRGTSSESDTKVIVLLVALAIATGAVGPIGLGSGGSGFFGMVLMLGGWWLLYQRRPEGPELPATDSASDAYTFPENVFPRFASASYSTPFTTSPTSEPDPGSPQQPVSLSKDDPTTATAGAAAPPAWDPLGVAPFAWDLPDPTPTHPVVPVEPPKKSRLTSTIIGVAILAAAAAGTVAATTELAWFTPARIAAIALAVVGLGLLIGSFLHRGYGLLVVTGPLAGFVILASLVGPVHFENSGPQRFAPTSAAELQSEYRSRFGDLELDLRNLELTDDHAITIDNSLSSALILLPENLDVDITCTDRLSSPCPAGFDGGADGVDGPVLNIDVTNTLASTEVQRG